MRSGISSIWASGSFSSSQRVTHSSSSPTAPTCRTEGLGPTGLHGAEAAGQPLTRGAFGPMSTYPPPPDLRLRAGPPLSPPLGLGVSVTSSWSGPGHTWPRGLRPRARDGTCLHVLHPCGQGTIRQRRPAQPHGARVAGSPCRGSRAVSPTVPPASSLTPSARTHAEDATAGWASGSSCAGDPAAALGTS